MDFSPGNCEKSVPRRLHQTLGLLPPKSSLLNENLFDLTKLIRSIQRSEGNTDCFRSGRGDCRQPDCTWRSLCLEQEAESKSDKED